MSARKIAIADCETDPFLHGRVPEPFVWGYYDGKTYKKFESTVKFIEFITEQNIILYAHNGGKFDWIFLTPYILPEEEIKIINGRLSCFNIGKCEFRDSYNILPTKLASYKKDDFDYSLLEKNVRHMHKQKIEQYLKNDCIYLYELVKAFMGEYGCHLTLASAALRYWKNLSKVEMNESSENFYHTFKDFYFGGRCQAFKKGIIKESISLIDINSAYPHAMTQQHPWGSAYDVMDDVELDEDIGLCFIDLDCVSRGAFPVRTKTGISFPDCSLVQNFKVTGWEYKTAIETGTISDISINTVYKFRESISFGDYVSHFFSKKAQADKSGDTAAYIMSKLFLNSLYGKMAANPNNYKYYETVHKNVAKYYSEAGMELAAEFEQCFVMSRELDDDEKIFYNVATGASITGFVRAYLWDAICNTTGVLYSDTDSIMFTGQTNVKLSDALGDWALEGNFNEGAICGKKLYALRGKKNKIASKGVKLTAAQLFRVANGETVIYKKDAPTYNLKKQEWRFITREVKMT